VYWDLNSQRFTYILTEIIGVPDTQMHL